MKTKAKAKTKPNIKITKDPVEQVEPIKKEEPEPILVEKPSNNNKVQEMVKCPGCSFSMTQHSLKYIYKKEDIAKDFSNKSKNHKKTKPLLKNHLD